MARERDDDDDRDDDEDERPRKKRSGGGAGDALGVVVPYKNAAALASYYCGVFGLLSCFIVGVGGLFGIVPVVLGILGIMKVSKQPEAHGTGHAITGIVLGTIEILTGCSAVGYFIFLAMNAPR